MISIYGLFRSVLVTSTHSYGLLYLVLLIVTSVRIYLNHNQLQHKNQGNSFDSLPANGQGIITPGTLSVLPLSRVNVEMVKVSQLSFGQYDEGQYNNSTNSIWGDDNAVKRLVSNA